MAATVAPRLEALFTITVPPLMVDPPVKVFAPPRMRVPVPVLFSIPVPLKTPLAVKVRVGSTMIVLVALPRVKFRVEVNDAATSSVAELIVAAPVLAPRLPALLMITVPPLRVEPPV